MASQEENESRVRVTLLAILTLVVVLSYAGSIIWTLYTGAVDFKEFSAALGPIAGTLLGFWIRGEVGD